MGDVAAGVGELRGAGGTGGDELGARGVELGAGGLGAGLVRGQFAAGGGERVGERSHAPAGDGMGGALGLQLARHRGDGRRVGLADGARGAQVRAGRGEGGQDGVARRALPVAGA